MINTPQQRKILIYFSVLYFVNMASRALFNPFITVYLQEKGIGTQGIGTVMAFNSLVIILSQPFWGMLADRIQSIRKTLVICFIFQALLTFSFNLVFSAILVGITFCLATFFSAPEGPLLDTWALNSLKGGNNENGLGRLKLWGCIGLSVFSVVSGLIIKRYSTSFTIPIFAVMLFIIAFVIFRSKFVDISVSRSIVLKEMHVGRIIQDKRLIVFLLYIFFMQISHRAAFTFYPVLISSLGGDKSMVGYASAIMFLSEALIMYFSKNMLAKMKPIYLIMGSSLFFAIWQVLFSMMTQSWNVIAAAVLDGPAFAMLTMGVLYYMNELAPKELRSTYQTVTYAVYYGLSGIAGNIMGGWVIEHLGFRTMYIAGACVTLTSTLVFLIVNRNISRRNSNLSSTQHLSST